MDQEEHYTQHLETITKITAIKAKLAALEKLESQ